MSTVFSEQLYVFPLERAADFAVLQSRVHEPWARLLSSSMRNDLRYSASDCFETFPFPGPMSLERLKMAGDRLYDTRAKYMVETNQGLTQTYNLLKNPGCTDRPVEALRALHEELDRAVLKAYGWEDIPVPPFKDPTTDAERSALEAFKDEVIDRLFALNAERAAEERNLTAAPKADVAPTGGDVRAATRTAAKRKTGEAKKRKRSNG